jgi:hypothetical protein
MNILLEAIDHQGPLTKPIDTHTKYCMMLVQYFINNIMVDILINYYAFIQLKHYFPNYRDKDELFDFGIINKESHQQVI